MLILSIKPVDPIVVVCQQTGRSFEVRFKKAERGEIYLGFEDPTYNYKFYRGEILPPSDMRWPALNPYNTAVARVRD